MNEKRCTRCDRIKPTTDFGKNAGRHDGLQVYCRPCLAEYQKLRKPAYNKRWYDKHADRERGKAVERYRLNPEPVRARSRKVNMTPEAYAARKLDVMTRAREIKRRVFAHYGEACACCGEAEPGFLTIDHVNGCGRETRKVHGLGGSFYRWLKNNSFPEGFQTLCYNCNQGRAKNGGICPHKVHFA